MYQVAVEKQITKDMMNKSFFDLFGRQYERGKLIFLAEEDRGLIQMDEKDITLDMRRKSEQILDESENDLYNL